MADNVLARATVAVSANVSDFDKAMDLLPAKSKKAVQKALDAIKSEMAKVSQALGQAGNSAADTKKLTDYQKQLAQNLDGVKKSAIGQAAGMGVANKAMGEIGKAAGFSGNKMQVFAQTLDDLQYVPEQGLRPILNNLIQISPALGVAGLVLQQFINHWDDLAKVFGGSPIKTVAQEMEELRKKTDLTATEFERLARADALKEKVKELRSGKTVGQQAEESAATTAIVNAGVGNVTAGLLKTDEGKKLIDSQGKAAQVLAKIDELNTQRRFAVIGRDAPGNPAASQAARNKIEEIDRQIADIKLNELGQARKETAEDKVAQAAIVKELGGRRKEFADMVRKNPAAFGGGDKEKGLALADALDRADPVTRTMGRIGEILRDGIANALQVQLPNQANEERLKIRDQQKAAGVEASQGLSTRVNSGVLAALARGEMVEIPALKSYIEREMKDAGYKDPEQYSEEAARRFTADANARVSRRALDTGGTREQAAAAIFGEDLTRLKAEAQRNRPSVGVTDIESFQREAQDALLKGSTNDALVEEQKRLAEAVAANTKVQEDLNKTMRERRQGLQLQ